MSEYEPCPYEPEPNEPEYCDICGEELCVFSHYHCGACNSVEVTGMFGHWDESTQRYTCLPMDVNDSIERTVERARTKYAARQTLPTPASPTPPPSTPASSVPASTSPSPTPSTPIEEA